MATKYFNLGSVLMAIFIFFITGLFSWFGNETMVNSKANVKFDDSIVFLNRTITKFGATVDTFTKRIKKIEDREHHLDMTLYKMKVDIDSLKDRNQ